VKAPNISDIVSNLRYRYQSQYLFINDILVSNSKYHLRSVRGIGLIVLLIALVLLAHWILLPEPRRFAGTVLYLIRDLYSV